MTEWEEAQEKVRAIHAGAVTLLAARGTDIHDSDIASAAKASLAIYKAAEDAVLGPLNEDAK